MSRQLINHNADLKALLDDGYEVAVRAGHLVIDNVPYIDALRQVQRGTLISVLELNGDQTIKPKKHIAMFAGEHPCDENGAKIRKFEHGSRRQPLGENLVADHSFSCKPKDGSGYTDYYHKMTTYAEMISAPARKIDPSATPRTHIVASSDEGSAIFNYFDTASTRAGIAAITDKLAIPKIGIIGLGGTGSYVLDLVSKTPAQEIHVFDGDDFHQHSAFRAPGAPTLEYLRTTPKKVDHFAALYAPMRKNIVPHDVFLTKDNTDLIEKMTFVFLCVDAPEAKGPIIERLEASGIPFIDVGMGVQQVDDKLLGVVRVTTSTPERRAHVKERVGANAHEGDEAYSQNIQVADLNALNAALAVIRWKKLYGFYVDLEGEHNCNYTIDGNTISNADGDDENK